jgi:hypothetical protein
MTGNLLAVIMAAPDSRKNPGPRNILREVGAKVCPRNLIVKRVTVIAHTVRV